MLRAKKILGIKVFNAVMSKISFKTFHHFVMAKPLYCYCLLIVLHTHKKKRAKFTKNCEISQLAKFFWAVYFNIVDANRTISPSISRPGVKVSQILASPKKPECFFINYVPTIWFLMTLTDSGYKIEGEIVGSSSNIVKFHRPKFQEERLPPA